MRPAEEELDLHGLTVDEAFPKLEQFVYSVFVAGKRRVRVAHGKGTGVLRSEARRYLSGHPLVKSRCTADRYHGGMGATEVELSDK